jgi:hypothetical protein
MKFLYSKKNICLLFLFIIRIKSDEENNCTLTRKGRADPFPSLLKCYKYNNEACCLSVHDDYIDTYISSLLSPSCIRRYPLFEILMCFGCHPNEGKYINKTTKEIRICKEFAKELWKEKEDQDFVDLNSSSKVFDQCGFKVDTEHFGNRFQDKTYIIPSEVFSNFSDFLEYVKIPFYEDYKIILQEQTDESCYNNNIYINYNIIFCFIYIFIFIFISII